MQANEVIPVVLKCVGELNLQLPPEERLETVPDTILVGDGSRLDSLNLINFLVMVEDAVSSELGAAVQLVDEGRMTEDDGPYRSVASLAEWIANQSA